MGYLSTTVQKIRYLVSRDDGDFLILQKTNGAFLTVALDTPASRDNPTIANVIRDVSGRVTSWTEDGVAHSITRNASGSVATLTVSGVTKTVVRDSSSRVIGIN